MVGGGGAGWPEPLLEAVPWLPERTRGQRQGCVGQGSNASPRWRVSTSLTLQQ